MKKINIKLLDPIHCRVQKDQVPLVRAAVEFEQERWSRGQFSRVKKKSMGSFIDGRGGLFLTGLIPRIEYFCKNKNIAINYQGSIESISHIKPNFSEVKLRTYQFDGVQVAMTRQRGCIVSPTGTGKTFTMAGICSALWKKDILILCHTSDLMKQLYEKLTWFGFKNLYRLSKDYKEHKAMRNGDNILIALIQSFSKVAEQYTTFFDAVLIDEAHHCVGTKTMYGKTLQKLLAPVRIGFTATMPTSRKDLLSLEGLLGPEIYKLPDKKAQEMGVLVKPDIKLVSVPYDADIADQNRRYRDLQKNALMLNERRNRIIMRIATRERKQGKRVLIIAREIKHLEALQKIGVDKFKTRARLVHGKVPNQARDQIKQYLNEKISPIVISSVVWKEGIDIPELDVVMLADIGKSEKALLQALGRGRRVTERKKKLTVYDCLDPYRFLAEHAIRRLQTYVKKGWL